MRKVKEVLRVEVRVEQRRPTRERSVVILQQDCPGTLPFCDHCARTLN